jgi:serine/threonine protein kinase
LHRDVKTDNMLLARDEWRLVISDFGFARKSVAGAMTLLGTEAFMAPEIQFGDTYGAAADVFGLGCVMAHVIFGREPGAGGFLERTPRNKFAADVEALRAAAPADAPPSFLECAVQCLGYEPEARPAAEVVVEWLRDLVKELEPFDKLAFPPPGELRSGAAKAPVSAPASGGGGGGSGSA